MQWNLIPFPKSIVPAEGCASCGAPVTEAIDNALPREGYVLSVGQEITLKAGSAQGLVWARNTLAQLKRQFPEGIPHVTIQDAPDYPIRGMHLDSARHMLPISELKKMMQVASFFKINTLHWHISDDQGWRIESKVFPLLHEKGAYRKGDHFGTHCSDEIEGGYYTQEEVRDFVTFCEELGIQVIPEVDIPGHVMAILHAYPHLSCRGEQVEVVTQSAITEELLCVGRDDVFDFLETLFGELLELFPAPWFHIGGDEAPKNRWQECPHCQRRMREEGLANLRELQGYAMNRVAAFLRKHGRRSMVWNDGAYGGNLDPDIVLHVWFPDQDSAIDTHVAKGGQLFVSPVDRCYCDYPHGEHPQRPIYELPLATDGTMIGSETLHWSEHIRTPERLQELAWPRGAAVAERCWSGVGDYADFCRRLEAVFDVFDHFGVVATPAESWDPDEEEAKRQTAAFHAQFDAANDAEKYEAQLAMM